MDRVIGSHEQPTPFDPHKAHPHLGGHFPLGVRWGDLGPVLLDAAHAHRARPPVQRSPVPRCQVSSSDETALLRRSRQGRDSGGSQVADHRRAAPVARRNAAHAGGENARGGRRCRNAGAGGRLVHGEPAHASPFDHHQRPRAVSRTAASASESSSTDRTTSSKSWPTRSTTCSNASIRPSGASSGSPPMPPTSCAPPLRRVARSSKLPWRALLRPRTFGHSARHCSKSIRNSCG